MIPFQWMVTGGTLLLGSGIFLVIFSVLSSISMLSLLFWRRIFRSWGRRRLQDLGVIQENPVNEQSRLDWKRLLLLLGFPMLALAVRDFLLSPLIVLIGMVIFIWLNFQVRQTERTQINEDAETVALQVRALMKTDHSLLNALSHVKLPPGTLRRALEQVTTRLHMHQSPTEAVRPLDALPGIVTARLSALVEHSARLTDAIQEELLTSLEQEAHRQKLLRSKTRQTLSLVRGTIRLLQAVVAGAIGFVMLAPDWRIFFLQDFSHRFLLAAMVIGVLLASLYFEYEVYQLTYGEV